MDCTNSDSAFLSRLENLQFALSKTTASQPSSQVDIYRNLFLHLREADDRSSNSFSEFSVEAERNVEKYAETVDNMDESGLNNFAAGALSLCHYHKNESSKWQTSLSVDKILSLSGLQETKKITESEKSDLGNIVVPLRVKKKPADKPSAGIYNSSFPIPRPLHDEVLVPSNASPYTPTFNNNTDWNRKKQPEVNVCNSFENHIVQTAGVNKCCDGDGMYQSHKSEPKEVVKVVTSKVGGPYANFGQKRKVHNNNWKYGKQGGGGKWDEDEEDEEKNKSTPFRTAKDQLVINQQKKYGGSNDRHQVTGSNYGNVKKSLGTRRGPTNKFVPPVIDQDSDNKSDSSSLISSIHRGKKASAPVDGMEEEVDERLKGIDPNMIELIKNDIMDQGAQITWSDIAGLDFAKKTIQEIVVWPMLRPDIFTGLRGPPKGLLLFGPPGTGKTLIGKCIASQSKSTFFCISASSLTSKWVGEGEKMVRALFAVARCSQPAVVFIDEVDSLLSQRSDSEHESSRRIKTEFLVQLDGASTASDERLLVIGATNRPQEIDEAARRRFVKRLLIPLPESVARKQIISNLMSQQRCNLSDSDLMHIGDKTEGYSGADMSNLCREAALGPIRSIPFEQMETITSDQVRPILITDFEQALLQVRASVSSKDLELYVDWNKTYGSFGH